MIPLCYIESYFHEIQQCLWLKFNHDDIMKWTQFLHYWPFVQGIHQSSVNSPHKGQWRRALMFSLICDWRNGWVNNQDAGDLRCHHAHYDITVMGDMSSSKAIRYVLSASNCSYQISLTNLLVVWQFVWSHKKESVWGNDWMSVRQFQYLARTHIMISCEFKVLRVVYRFFWSLCNLTGTSAVLLLHNYVRSYEKGSCETLKLTQIVLIKLTSIDLV